MKQFILITFAADYLNIQIKRMNLKILRRTVFVLLAVLTFVSAKASPGLEEFLKELPLKNLKILEKEAFYNTIYEVMFEQPVDHKNPEKGTFEQRLYISHIDENLPVVLVTEGYTADYYYTSEPAVMLRCNQIIAEHRYFGESVPDSIEWEFLTTWQAASDHHNIINRFSKFYRGDWITTGISKGGQTAMFHSFYYPDDADVIMPYVAPLNNSTEDLRIYDFLADVGSGKCRKKIEKFQKYALKNQDALLPAFKSFSDSKRYTYELAGGIETAFEYCVLEYSFAFWQWGYADCKEIPGRNAEPSEIIAHMNMVAGFDYFADEFIVAYRTFFYQALTEMGYYGYNLSDFQPYLRHVTQPGFEFTMPADLEIRFDDSVLKEVDHYLKTEADNFIFIYGEYDTWSATAVDLGSNTESRVFYKEKGSHRTRVRNMDEAQQLEIKHLLNEYLAE